MADDTDEEKQKIGVAQYIFLAFMILITFYLTFLYIKSKEFHTYSCYNIIIMSVVVFLGTLLNIVVPTDEGSEYAQLVCGIVKDLFNKMILSILTMQVITLYLGIIKTELYDKREKLIFLIGIFASFGVSLVISFFLNILKWVDEKYYEYLNNYKIDKQNGLLLPEDLEKRWYALIITEVIFCVIIFVINVCCLAVVLSHLSKKEKDAKAGIIEDLGYKKQLVRFILMFILNIVAIVISLVFLTFDVFDPTLNQTIFLGFMLVIDLCYSLNRTVYIETLKIFCKNKVVEENSQYTELKKKSTYAEDDGDDDADDN